MSRTIKQIFCSAALLKNIQETIRLSDRLKHGFNLIKEENRKEHNAVELKCLIVEVKVNRLIVKEKLTWDKA